MNTHERKYCRRNAPNQQKHKPRPFSRPSEGIEKSPNAPEDQNGRSQKKHLHPNDFFNPHFNSFLRKFYF